jgi:hypothetical protein
MASLSVVAKYDWVDFPREFSPATLLYTNAWMMANSHIAPMQATHQRLRARQRSKLPGLHR